MAMRKILVDETNRELCEHGTVGFPMTVNHDDLWAFEGKSVPIHWHNDLEISLPREGEAIYQVYQKSYTVRPGDVLLLNRNVPHSCHSPNNSHARYSTFLARPDFIHGEYGSDVERRCFRPFLQNSSVPCILLTSGNSCTRTVIQKLNETEALFDQKTFCYELKIKGLLCEIFGMILCEHQNDLAKFIPANQLELERLEQMLDYLNTHFGSVISLQELADQVHLSREVCCRLFKKMTGKTITGYLEEYRVNQSLPLVQSCQYSMIQIADMTGFSNASRFARAFRRQFGCNPGEYNSLKLQNQNHLFPIFTESICNSFFAFQSVFFLIPRSSASSAIFACSIDPFAKISFKNSFALRIFCPRPSPDNKSSALMSYFPIQ